MFPALKGGQLSLLNQKQIAQVHEATIEILEEVGIKVKSEKAREIFAQGGAAVEGEIVKISASMLEAAIKSAPSKVILYGQEEKNDLHLEKNRTHLGTGGTVLYALDLDKGKKRKTNTHDVRDIARMVDYLDNVSFYVINTYPTDVPDEAADVNRFYWALTNTTKHVMGGMYTMEGLKNAIKIAETIAGSPQKLRERPFVSFITLMVSPLVMDGLYTDFLIEVAGKGLPLAIPSEPLNGATSPVTLAGTIAINNAESLAGIVLAQLVNPGTPVLFGSTSSIMDMSQGFYVAGCIESAMVNAGLAQMAQYYELPMYGTAGMSDSKTNDSQAGYESALTAMTVALAGCNYIHDAVGLLEMCQVFSYEKMVTDNEIIGNIFRVMQGIEVNEDTLAVARIKEVGPAGHFLADPHTVKYVRKEFFFPRVSDRRTRIAWEEAGCPETKDRAHGMVRDILAVHKPAPVSPGLKVRIREEFPEIKGEEV